MYILNQNIIFNYDERIFEFCQIMKYFSRVDVNNIESVRFEYISHFTVFFRSFGFISEILRDIV